MLGSELGISITFSVSATTAAMIDKLALHEEQSRSAILRKLVRFGLANYKPQPTLVVKEADMSLEKEIAA